jgi:hypothetical protein
VTDKRRRFEWRECDMRGMTIQDMDLEGADMRASDVSGCNFVRCNLRYVDWRGAKMHGTIFENSDMYGSKMQGVDMFHTIFHNTGMRQVVMSGSYVREVLRDTMDAVKEASDKLSRYNEQSGIGKSRTAEQQAWDSIMKSEAKPKDNQQEKSLLMDKGHEL